MIEIRPERPADEAAVREVHLQAFGQPQEADLVDKLRENRREALSLAAIADDRLVGHVLFNPAVIEGKDGMLHGVGLAPMAVLPQFQRQGVGSSLLRSGIAELADRRCPFVIVLGHPDYLHKAVRGPRS